MQIRTKDKEWLTTLLLCLSWEDWEYTGSTGKSGNGVAMLLTCGGLGIWSIIDLVMIAADLTDAQGRR